MNNETGKVIIVIGIAIIVIGAIVYYWGDKLHFIGNLPGDIKIEKENFKFYFPITTMILLSIVINLLIRLFNYLKG